MKTRAFNPNNLATVKTLGVIVGASLLLGAAIVIASTTCYSYARPEAKSCWDPSTNSTQTMAWQDQKKSAEAYVWCLGGTCDQSTCKEGDGPSSGCTQNGSYDNCWTQTSTSEKDKLCNDGTTELYSNYTFGTNLTNQGQTTKYIVDMMNCGE